MGGRYVFFPTKYGLIRTDVLQCPLLFIFFLAWRMMGTRENNVHRFATGETQYQAYCRAAARGF